MQWLGVGGLAGNVDGGQRRKALVCEGSKRPDGSFLGICGKAIWENKVRAGRFWLDGVEGCAGVLANVRK